MRLMDQVWPQLTRERAAANLQVRLSELRRALRTVGEAERLETRAPGYVLRVEPSELDLMQFEQLVAGGAVALGDGDPRRRPGARSGAVAVARSRARQRRRCPTSPTAEQARLEEERFSALESSESTPQLACGRHAETIARARAIDRQRSRCASGSGSSGCWRCTALGGRPRRYAHSASCDHTWSSSSGSSQVTSCASSSSRILRQDPRLSTDARRAATEIPQTRYVESGGVHIAYQVVGNGHRDIVFVPGLMSHVELAWEDPGDGPFLPAAARRSGG